MQGSAASRAATSDRHSTGCSPTPRGAGLILSWRGPSTGSAAACNHLIATLADLQAAGIDLYLRQQAIDTTTPSGRALFQMLGVFAEFERAMIRERVQAGVDRAKAAGITFGRPRKSDRFVQAIRDSLASGVSIRKTAQQHRVAVSTVQRIKAAATA
jgi:DNA invertase Pin-like site-specific DNA recombinase